MNDSIWLGASSVVEAPVRMKECSSFPPDYKVVVHADVLDASDGPMLRHGLQELHGSKIILPRRETWRPSRDALAERFERFRKVG